MGRTVLVLAGLAWGGCLVPQDDTYLAGLPETRNRPPRIVESQVRPTERIIQDFGADLCELEFSVAVEDPDVDDTVTVRWYVDANPQKPEYKLANNGQALRGDQATLRLNLRAANSPLSAPGVHLVEALVTDARLVDREPEPVQVIKLPDGGVIQDPGYVVTYAWFINTVQGDCQ